MSDCVDLSPEGFADFVEDLDGCTVNRYRDGGPLHVRVSDISSLGPMTVAEVFVSAQDSDMAAGPFDATHDGGMCVFYALE